MCFIHATRSSLSQLLFFFASERTRDAMSSSRPALALEPRPAAVYLEISSRTTDHTLAPRSLILVPTNPCARASPCCCVPCYFRTTNHTLRRRSLVLVPTNSSCAPASPCCCVPCHFRMTEHTLGPRSFVSGGCVAIELQRRLDRSGDKIDACLTYDVLVPRLSCWRQRHAAVWTNFTL